MQRAVIAIVILAALVGGYFWFASDEPVESTDLELGSNPTAAESPAGKGVSLERAERPGPVPDVEPKTIEGEGHLLMIARLRSTWTATLENSFKRLRKLQFRTWYLTSAPGEAAGPHPGVGRGLTELAQQPTAEYLRDNDIQVLVFDEADPNTFPDLFWNVVAERVRSGAMGLYFRPGVPMADDGTMLSAHPALSHPVLKELLPVKSARPISGSPVPGVFTVQQEFLVTRAGREHPASRLVVGPEASQSVWTGAVMGEGGLGTKFCYPVEELKPDAVRLIDLDTSGGVPAVVISGGPGRVLWMGNNDLGDRQTHYKLEKNILQMTLLNHWWVWLMGQAKE